MKLQILFALSALVALAGCSKSENTSETQTKSDPENITAEKTIVAYLGVAGDNQAAIGASATCQFSDAAPSFGKEGGSKSIVASDRLPTGRHLQVSIDGTEAVLFTDQASSLVRTVTTPLYWPYNDLQYANLLRVPTGAMEKVKYSDETYGYIPDSALVPLYPIAGKGYQAVLPYLDTAGLRVDRIEGPWFSVTFDWSEEYAIYSVKSLSVPRQKFNARGEILSSIWYDATDFLYEIPWQQPKPMSFVIEVSPNTTGKSRTFTISFPYALDADPTIFIYEKVTVVQQ